MQKICLVAINSRYTHANLALFYLRTYVEDLNYKVEILEFSINLETSEIIRQIKKQNHEVLGFSVYIWNVEIVKIILNEIRTGCPETKIILGGPEVSYNGEEWLESYPVIDYIITGPGETGFRTLLLNNLQSKEKIIDVSNPHFSEIPFPYKTADFINLKQKYIYYESSRGCSHRCTFCVSSHLGQKLEFKNIELVKDEINIIMEHRPEIVKFIDRTFNAKKSFFREIWKYIIDNFSESGTKFHFEIHPGLIEQEDIEFLRGCPQGLFQFEIGIQSTFEKTLKEIKRDSWGKIKTNVGKLLELKNIHSHLDLIAGLPFEGLEKIKNSFNNVYSLKPHHLQLGFLKVLRGTEIYKKSGSNKITCSKIAPYRIKSNRWLSENEIEKLVKISELLDVLYNSGRLRATLKNMEKLYNSNYDLYDNLADVMYEKIKKSGSNKWEIIIDEILKFITGRFPGNKQLLIDCLRWDWCKSSGAHHYPGQLKSEFTKNLKKAGYNFFKKYSNKGVVEFKGEKFSASHLRKAIFFSPETEDFKEEYPGKKNFTVFMPGSDSIINFDPDE